MTRRRVTWLAYVHRMVVEGNLGPVVLVLSSCPACTAVCLWGGGPRRFDQLPATLEGLYNDATPKGQYAREPREPEGWKRFDALMPAFPDACELSRVGLKDWDGGKWICGLEKIPDSKERPCVVYSIGSNDQYDFEGVVRETTNCTVETFDCTAEGALPGYMRDRVRFHKICLGNPADADAAAGMKFMTLRQIMAMLGHEYVTLLKADIEG